MLLDTLPFLAEKYLHSHIIFLHLFMQKNNIVNIYCILNTLRETFALFREDDFTKNKTTGILKVLV